MHKITIAIDGYSSCGKSTLAKALAQKLNYKYIDTGAMYRAVAWYALKNGIIDQGQNIDNNLLLSNLNKIDVSFEFNQHTQQSDVYLNGHNIESNIRTMKVSSIVSKISSIKEVREKMVSLQRIMGEGKGFILDGRDIGTHVFPKAELKLFMTANTDIRAKRRQDEYFSKQQYFSLEEVKQSLIDRDNEDINRQENPLIQAQDAVVIDNSNISREQQLGFVLKLIEDLKLISE